MIIHLGNFKENKNFGLIARSFEKKMRLDLCINTEITDMVRLLNHIRWQVFFEKNPDIAKEYESFLFNTGHGMVSHEDIGGLVRFLTTTHGDFFGISTFYQDITSNKTIIVPLLLNINLIGIDSANHFMQLNRTLPVSAEKLISIGNSITMTHDNEKEVELIRKTIRDYNCLRPLKLFGSNPSFYMISTHLSRLAINLQRIIIPAEVLGGK